MVIFLHNLLESKYISGTVITVFLIHSPPKLANHLFASTFAKRFAQLLQLQKSLAARSGD